MALPPSLSGNPTDPQHDYKCCRQNLSLDTVENSIRVEFAVNFSHQDDLTKIGGALKSKGLELAAVDLEDKTIQVEIGTKNAKGEPNHDVQTLQEFIERETGFTTVIKGLGQLASAVAELRPPPESKSDTIQTFGVVRLTQMTNGSCFVDGVIDGISQTKKEHDVSRNMNLLLAVHEYGDLSGEAFESIGRPLVKIMEQTVDNLNDGDNLNSISVRKVVPNCNVPLMIGKSIALSGSFQDDFKTEGSDILCAGVVARTSTVGVNKKQVCTCSGKTLWEERLGRQRRE